MDSDRVLKTGGPLGIWRREIERRGEDVAEAMVEGLTPSNLANAITLMDQRLGDKMYAWSLLDVVKGMVGTSWYPPKSTTHGFQMAGKGEPSHFWAVCEASDILGRNTLLFKWSSHKGFEYCHKGILKMCVQRASVDLGATPFCVDTYWRHHDGGDWSQVSFDIHWAPLEHERDCVEGVLEKAQVFDYVAIAGEVSRALREAGIIS